MIVDGWNAAEFIYQHHHTSVCTQTQMWKNKKKKKYISTKSREKKERGPFRLLRVWHGIPGHRDVSLCLITPSTNYTLLSCILRTYVAETSHPIYLAFSRRLLYHQQFSLNIGVYIFLFGWHRIDEKDQPDPKEYHDDGGKTELKKMNTMERKKIRNDQDEGRKVSWEINVCLAG